MSGSGLVVSSLVVRFGGLVAVDDVSLSAPGGRITGLIGPNGAGKTTLFNVCNGLLRPARGSVHLDGRDITRASTARRPQLGLGRTFQRIALFDSLSVRENVALGREGSLAGSLPWRQLVAGRGEQRLVTEAADEALATCGITGLANRPAGSLSAGDRRLVELARVLAGGFSMLLLDEPSSGLDDHESQRFGEILTAVVRDRDVGILLVEHHMELVLGICDYLYVLDFGRLIFAGTPDDAVTSDVVRAAYLGTAVA
jgi:ABC-type branched-subunit amino acid transport system ATPase component